MRGTGRRRGVGDEGDGGVEDFVGAEGHARFIGEKWRCDKQNGIEVVGAIGEDARNGYAEKNFRDPVVGAARAKAGRAMTTETTTRSSWDWLAAQVALVLALGWLPRSLPGAQALLFGVALPLWGFGMFRRGRAREILRCPLAPMAIVFAVIALATAPFGPKPMLSLSKSSRLMMLFLIPAMVTFYGARDLRGWRRVEAPVFLFVGCCTVLAAMDVWRIGREAMAGKDLVDIGTMRLPQLYAVALCLLVAAVAHPRWRNWWWLWAIAVMVNGCGVIGHFKRGIWCGTAVGVLVMAIALRRRAVVWVLLAATGLLLLLPTVRHRLGDLSLEFTSASGTRKILWTEVTPSLARSYPFGMGYGVLRIEDIEAHGSHLPAWEKGRLWHLHNSPLQILVEMSAAGLVAWLIWMTQAIRCGVRASRDGDEEERWAPAGALGGLCAMLAMGMTENTFGGSHQFVVITMLLGIIAAFAARPRPLGVLCK
jgi:hypothetical protein